MVLASLKITCLVFPVLSDPDSVHQKMNLMKNIEENIVESTNLIFDERNVLQKCSSPLYQEE